MAKSSQQVGKDFERALESAFKSLSTTHGFKHHKLVDSYQAGNMVSEQPSDYLVAVGGKVSFLEAKASSTSKKLRPSMLKAGQRGAIEMYARMLDCPYGVIFHSELTGNVEVFNGSDVLLPDFSKRYDKYVLDRFYIGQMVQHLTQLWDLDPIEEVIERYQQTYGEQA